MKIYKIGIEKKHAGYNDLKRECVVAQGWPESGDLSFFTNEKNKGQFYSLIPHSHNEKGELKTRFKNFISHFFEKMKPGDIVLAFEGNNLKGICELPPKFCYYFNNQMSEYKNCLFPVEWIDWNQFAQGSKLVNYKQGGRGVPGVTLCNIELIENFINKSWAQYKQDNNITVQLTTKEKKLQELLSELPQKIETSRKRYYRKLNMKVKNNLKILKISLSAILFALALIIYLLNKR
jgi:hypothetical protein